MTVTSELLKAGENGEYEISRFSVKINSLRPQNTKSPLIRKTQFCLFMCCSRFSPVCNLCLFHWAMQNRESVSNHCCTILCLQTAWKSKTLWKPWTIFPLFLWKCENLDSYTYSIAAGVRMLTGTVTALSVATELTNMTLDSCCAKPKRTHAPFCTGFESCAQDLKTKERFWVSVLLGLLFKRLWSSLENHSGCRLWISIICCSLFKVLNI